MLMNMSVLAAMVLEVLVADKLLVMMKAMLVLILTLRRYV